MTLVDIAATSLALLIGLPLALLMAAGLYANSPAAERRAWRRIRQECERQGCTDIEPFTNSRSSFGVRYRKDGGKHRGKCAVGLLDGKVHWEHGDPATVGSSSDS